MMIGLSIGLGCLVLILGYTTINLLLKNEKQEDSLENQEKILASYLGYLDRISRVIEVSSTKIKEIDHKGSFKSDDEIGFFFEQVKEIQNILNEFIIKYEE